MVINRVQEGDKLVLNLEGKLDSVSSPQLQEVLIPAFDETKNLVLNFEKLSYVSSAGLRVLLLGQKTANAKGAAMSLAHVSPDILEILDMTGFSDMLNIA